MVSYNCDLGAKWGARGVEVKGLGRSWALGLRVSGLRGSGVYGLVV